VDAPRNLRTSPEQVRRQPRSGWGVLYPDPNQEVSRIIEACSTTVRRPLALEDAAGVDTDLSIRLGDVAP